MSIDYEKIQQSINEYGKYILNCIKNQYSSSLTLEQLKNIEELLNTQFIIIEKPSNEDIEFFSKQAGITNPEDYSIDYIPSAHGGRAKGDNKIHIYPYTKAFESCETDDEIIKSCIDNIVVHEIFHYFIRPNLSDENRTKKDEFGHFITEGLVQYYTEEFAKKYRLGNPKSNYDKNVEFAKKLISSFPNNLTQSQIDNIIFTYNQDQLLELSKNGKELYDSYIDNLIFQDKISSFIIEIGKEIGMDINDEKLKGIIRHYKKMDNREEILNELYKGIEVTFNNNELLKNDYILKLNNIISNGSNEDEIHKHR